MSTPIWVTDPTGNNNPYLKIVGSLFVGAEDAQYILNTNTINANMNFWWSSDGINWQKASNAAGTLSNLGMDTTFLYANGSWAAILTYFPAAQPAGQDVGVYSNDGKNWLIAISPPLTGHIDVSVTYDSGGNRWHFVWNGQDTFINNPNTPNRFSGNDLGSGGGGVNLNGPFADPSQTAAPANNTLSNSLPSGWTAVRYGIDSSQNPNPDILQYTTTPITTAIVNSGSGWPSATWVTTFTYPHSAVNGGGPLFFMTFARPSPT